MHIGDAATPLTCAGKMSAIDLVAGLRPSDALLVTQLPELKTDYDQLSRSAYMKSIDMNIVDLLSPLIGGLGGGAEGTAIVTVASHIMGVICYLASYHLMGTSSLRWNNTTDRMGLWIQAVAGQALARNTPLVSFNDINARSGLGTETLLWEVVAGAVIGAVCGLHQHGVGSATGTKTDQTSGLEARFQAEVARAGLKLSRGQANEIVLEALQHFESKLENPEPGKPFPEVYDVDRLVPNEEWLGIYHKVREDLYKLGLKL
jgi:hypothetical protein